jgi:DNA-binding NarL/FixJ family response regulator
MGGRLALVDDHELFRHALGDLLCARGFDVVAQAADARSSFGLVDRLRPDVVLLDLEMPGMDGVTATREMLHRPCRPKVMIVSAYGAPHQVAEAWAAGVHGFALKSIPIAGLIHGIEAVIAGDRYLAPGLIAADNYIHGPLSVLSARERDIFRLLVRGLTTRQIAAQLCISPKTVETHRERVLRKLELHSVVQLVRFAANNDLLD